METLEYRCPSCNAYLVFDAESGQMKCDYCMSSFPVDQIKSKEDGRGKVANEGGENVSESKEGEFNSYSCPACGGEIISTATTAATECLFCGNPTVITQRLSGEFKPDFVIPFNVTKEEAIKSLQKLYKGKKLLPKEFTQHNRIQKITGLYVPYWICDCKVSGTVYYNATRVRTYTDGDYLVTRTEHYKIERGGAVAFDNIPQDGTTKMEGEHTESIEPYDYSQMVPFANQYLSGYFADIYDVPAADVLERVSNRAKNSVEGIFRKSIVGYSTVTRSSSQLSVMGGDVHYALLPVWVLNTRWKDKTYTFAMNGQTGKAVGDLPVDKKKFWLRLAMYTGIFSAIGCAIVYMFMR